jgi:hypothetical protein
LYNPMNTLTRIGSNTVSGELYLNKGHHKIWRLGNIVTSFDSLQSSFYVFASVYIKIFCKVTVAQLETLVMSQVGHCIIVAITAEPRLTLLRLLKEQII